MGSCWVCSGLQYDLIPMHSIGQQADSGTGSRVVNNTILQKWPKEAEVESRSMGQTEYAGLPVLKDGVADDGQ